MADDKSTLSLAAFAPAKNENVATAPASTEAKHMGVTEFFVCMNMAARLCTKLPSKKAVEVRGAFSSTNPNCIRKVRMKVGEKMATMLAITLLDPTTKESYKVIGHTTLKGTTDPSQVYNDVVGIRKAKPDEDEIFEVRLWGQRWGSRFFVKCISLAPEADSEEDEEEEAGDVAW